MKKVLLILVGVVFFQTANAQLLKFGLRGGVSTSSFKVRNNNNFGGLITDITEGDATFGIHGGLAARINIPVIPIFIQPELLITSAGGEYRVSTIGSGPNIAKVNYTRLDFPILVGFKFGPARVNAGPVGSIMLNEKNGLSDFEIRQDFRSTNWGYQAGLGLDVWKISVDLRYEGNLSKFGESVNIGGNSYNLDTRANQVILGLTYWL